MSDDYTLKYTDGYANYSGKINEAELEIDGDCKITNYDPRENGGEDALKKGSITINFSDDEQIIEIGNNNNLVKKEKADFSKKKYSIFKEIAALDGDAEELSVDDIKKMDKSLADKWGLQELRLDYRNGVATLVWGKDDILRIDFKTWREKIFGESNSNKVKPAVHKEETVKNNEPEIIHVYKVVSGDNMDKIAKKYDLFVWEIKNANKNITNIDTLSIGTELKIPKSNVPKRYDDLNKGSKNFLNDLAKRESSGRQHIENSVGYLGLYQMGEKALETIGVYQNDGTAKNDWKKDCWVKDNKLSITGKEDFLNSKDKQDQAVIRYAVRNWIELETNLNLNYYIGKKINGI